MQNPSTVPARMSTTNERQLHKNNINETASCTLTALAGNDVNRTDSNVMKISGKNYRKDMSCT